MFSCGQIALAAITDALSTWMGRDWGAHIQIDPRLPDEQPYHVATALQTQTIRVLPGSFAPYLSRIHRIKTFDE